MDICLNINSEKKVDKSLVLELSRLVEYVLKHLQTDSSCVSVNFVSEGVMRKMNKQYRGKDKATDVLSFAVCDGKSAEFVGVGDLGDIFLCASVIKKQAKEFGVAFEDGLFRVVVHGVLHLIGYDHEKSKKEEKKMFDLQEKILNRYEQKKNKR